jgi:redox-sensitive bicupin YhaK (pirin superfamily)
VQTIRSGDIHLLKTAGSGILHSERVPEPLRHQRARIEGLQLWVALPEGKEELAPSFQHVGRSDIQEVSVDGLRIRILIGAALA